MAAGDKLVLFNGQGDEIEGRVENIFKNSVEVLVLNRKKAKKSLTRVILACAIPKKAKFEFIIEKCTELGVDEIIPMRTARTEVILKDDRQLKKNTRYQAVAINAAKQSGRLTVPVVHPQRLFKDVLTMAPQNALRLIPSLIGERKSLKEVLKSTEHVDEIIYLIGPEGDFTAQEVEMALTAGFISVSLGQTTLKVDTAAIMSVGFARLILEE